MFHEVGREVVVSTKAKSQGQESRPRVWYKVKGKGKAKTGMAGESGKGKSWRPDDVYYCSLSWNLFLCFLFFFLFLRF